MDKSNLIKISIPKKIFRYNTRVGLSLLFLFASISQIHAKKYSINIESLSKNNTSVIQQTSTQKKTIKGTVKDNNGVLLQGATIVQKGTLNTATTDRNGEYTIAVENDKAILVFSFVGFLTQEVHIDGKSIISVSLVEDASKLDEVVVVAYGEQKKESVISSVTSVKPSDLKIPASNLTTALAGQVAGIIATSSSGEPGQDNADFFIRGVTTFGYAKGPLILIDGVEMTTADLARMQVDDIASFSILKDATATSVYGARGANGVILVTTKEGTEGKVQFNIRYENSWSQPTENIEFADPITYMKLHNEAIKTRNPKGGLLYSQDKIANSSDPNRNQYVYPTNDWREMMLKDITSNQRLNLSASGGGKVARYYFAGSYNYDSGLLKVNGTNNFNNNIDIKKYLLRSNININVTPTTKATVRFYTTIDDYNGPLAGGSETYRQIMQSNPVLFPAYYAPDAANEFTEHILFGNSGTSFAYINPYANMVKGYQDNSRSLTLSQFEVNQNLDAVTKGLSLNVIANANWTSAFGANRSYNPFYYEVASFDRLKNEYTLTNLNPLKGTESLNYTPVTQSNSSVFYLEARSLYNHTFNQKHDVGGLLVFIARQSKFSNATDIESSLPSRNLGLSGRLTYGYDRRYFAEFSFGYNGSERFSQAYRYGFFPSFGVGWTVSNESFFEPVKDVVTLLKLKATYGVIGNDNIGAQSDRFFYISKVNLDNSGNGYQFGTDFNYNRNGNSIDRYANELVTWETSYKRNLGLELDLYRNIKFRADYYTEYRKNILMDRISIPSTMGLTSTVKGNIGETSSNGIDMSLEASHTFPSGFWISGRGNFTYATSFYEKYEEPNYGNLGAPWRSRIGTKLGQYFGYVAERLFIDEADVSNSPVQFLPGQYGAGDIKYKDVDGNGRIDELDKVAIGHPSSPEIVYGFGSSIGYKNIDLSFFFQGLANRSFMINPRETAPFLDNTGGETAGNNALLKVYADNVWLEENRNPYALFPRLSTTPNENNEQISTWHMKDGAFIRLKSVELGYKIPEKVTDRLKFNNIRLYVSGLNLFTMSKFKLWDVEMGGNGLNYPIQKVFNLGVQASF